jgi:metal-dependent amidase/aminoacylase/carboxypeptidase family protein
VTTIGGPPVTFPDAAAAVIAYFNTVASLAGVPIHQVEPNPLPATFVLVKRIGGHARNLVIDDAYLTIEAWAPTEAEAHDVAQHTRAEIHAAVGHYLGTQFCYRVDEIGGLAMSPDPDTAKPRYTWTVSVSLRGTT